MSPGFYDSATEVDSSSSASMVISAGKKITVRETSCICLMQNVNFTADYSSSGLLIPFMIEAVHCSLIISFF